MIFERLYVSGDVCQLTDRFSLSHSHTDFIALVPPSVERNKVCIRDYTWIARDCFFHNNFSEF